MATVVRHELLGCDGFRLESPKGLVGWVEETWLGPGDDPAALAVRTTDGREALLLAEDVARVSSESELLLMRAGARLLELDVPRLETSPSNGLSASWRTTGNVLEPPDPPGAAARALLAIRPWRLTPPHRPGAERPILLTVVALYAVLTLIVLLLIGLDFLAARLAA
jgi:hypothetical protein